MGSVLAPCGIYCQHCQTALLNISLTCYDMLRGMLPGSVKLHAHVAICSAMHWQLLTSFVHSPGCSSLAVPGTATFLTDFSLKCYLFYQHFLILMPVNPHHSSCLSVVTVPLPVPESWLCVGRGCCASNSIVLSVSMCRHTGGFQLCSMRN